MPSGQRQCAIDAFCIAKCFHVRARLMRLIVGGGGDYDKWSVAVQTSHGIGLLRVITLSSATSSKHAALMGKMVMLRVVDTQLKNVFQFSQIRCYILALLCSVLDLEDTARLSIRKVAKSWLRFDQDL